MATSEQAGPSSQPESETIVPAEYDNVPATDEQTAAPNPIVLRFRKLGGDLRDNWNRFRHFMWDKEKREVMGRNGKSWAQIGLFYLCFFLGLAGFWAAMFAIFYQTISLERPKYNSLITPPGLNLVPFPDNQRRIEYSPDESDADRMRIEQQIDEFVFQPLMINQSGYLDCSDLPPANVTDPQRFCRYDPSLLGECAPGNSSYNTTEPCLYMGLNRVWGWIPEGFEVDELIMPKFNKSPSFQNRIFFTCEVREEDRDFVDSLNMYPPDGVSFGHYPYVVGTDERDQARYIRPVVAVQVALNTRDVDVNIECRARAANIPEEAPGGLFDSREEPSRFRVRVMVRS
ncbi:sodium/potassium-transporting ATPase subunit beta-1-like [Acanthaster planci]|uniref:Sodium/potassium-transporting ATPase subunit beta-1-like n=1 Tax=Acanthaster planci TaxID=133434 RepID=A0A8B7YJU0_ACAPL|nr:sodium/potassium-transporting ATPase subunit beta-1-like [Acanthaster planci]